MPTLNQTIINTTFRTLDTLDQRARKGLIVSCQPVDGGPMDRHETVAQLALAALVGGAAVVRI